MNPRGFCCISDCTEKQKYLDVHIILSVEAQNDSAHGHRVGWHCVEKKKSKQAKQYVLYARTNQSALLGFGRSLEHHIYVCVYV